MTSMSGPSQCVLLRIFVKANCHSSRGAPDAERGTEEVSVRQMRCVTGIVELAKPPRAHAVMFKWHPRRNQYVQQL